MWFRCSVNSGGGGSGFDLLAAASAGDGSSTRTGFDLTDANLQTTATRIPQYMFYKNINIERISLANVISVERNAFEDAKYIKEIDLPNCTTLGTNNVFYNACQAHNSTSLPSVRINLPKVAIIYDKGLGQVGYTGGLPATLILTACTQIKDNGIQGLGSNNYMDINELLLPNLTSLGSNSLAYHHIGTIDIGSSCTEIKNKPFANGVVTNLIVRATTPPSLNSNGLGCTPTHIYVPSGSVTAYQSAATWSNYSSIIEAIPS